ncbi:hypothetical protein JCM9140_3031 [Halalkalibacter wakoensis JCM 9140]|uniref:HTH lysR-type domain-containing protein n=1 Tax=Halalkalibacter wakoensis JCM 9140 TaxID=1236970 RepID=W4Q5G7_9BACI|nr:LysR family transcriptional regulator [Halalkalibacter wakoensis]GAE26923.1 hypothetical protein JCM9140_3031 [Halalkalibacter wakoensis JCM 9140]
MDLESLNSFLVIAREKSISKAASLLHVTQPTLSSRIKNLESDLGLKLVNRDWKGIQLTTEGYYFVIYISKLLNDLDDVSMVLKNIENKEDSQKSFYAVTNTSRLRIGIDSWLAPSFSMEILNEVQKASCVDYQIITRPSATIEELLRYGVIDMGFFYHYEGGSQYDSSYQLVDEMVLLFHSKYGSISEDLAKLDFLSEKPFLLFDNPVLVYHRNLSSMLIEQFNIERFQVVDDINVMINTISLDQAYTIVPKTSVLHLMRLFDLNIMPIKYFELGDQAEKVMIKMAYNKDSEFDTTLESMTRNIHQELVANYGKK